jgi:hypothetical protein
VFKTLSNLKKLELQDTEAAKGNYREQLFKLLKNLETVDGKNSKGDEVDSTVYDDEDEGDELDDEGEGKDLINLDGDFEDDEGDFEDDDDFDDEEDEEEEKPQKGKKPRKS